MTLPTVVLSARRRVLALAAPIMLAMGSQNLVNIVDVLMVSQLGEAALAAVGLGAFVVFSIQALTLGASSGVQITTARMLGSGQSHRVGEPLANALLLCLAVLPLASYALYSFASALLPLLHDDAAVADNLVAYTQARIWSLTFVAANFAFRGHLSAVERARLFLYVALAMHATNITLNYVLIFGHFGIEPMGAAGAGWATTVATALGALCYLYLLRRQVAASTKGGLQHSGDLLKIAVPYGLQQSLLTVGGAVLLWIVGKMGTTELAAGTVVLNVMLFATLPAIGIGVAAASLIGQSAASHQPQSARGWLDETLKLAFGFCTTLAMLMWLLGEPLLGLFLADPAARELALWPLRIIALTVVLDGFGLVLSQALYASGRARATLGLTSALQWGACLPAAYLLGPGLDLGLSTVMTTYLAYRGLLALLLWRLWLRGPLAKFNHQAA